MTGNHGVQIASLLHRSRSWRWNVEHPRPFTFYAVRYSTLIHFLRPHEHPGIVDSHNRGGRQLVASRLGLPLLRLWQSLMLVILLCPPFFGLDALVLDSEDSVISSRSSTTSSARVFLAALLATPALPSSTRRFSDLISFALLFLCLGAVRIHCLRLCRSRTLSLCPLHERLHLSFQDFTFVDDDGDLRRNRLQDCSGRNLAWLHCRIDGK